MPTLKSLIETRQWDPYRKLNALIEKDDDFVAMGETRIKIDGNGLFFADHGGLFEYYGTAELIINDKQCEPQISERLKITNLMFRGQDFGGTWVGTFTLSLH